MKVIIVEDDFIVADHLRLMLQKHDVQVLKIIDSAEEAIESIATGIDLFMVDIRLSGEKTGIDLGRQLSLKNIPFIYLTANNELQTLKIAAQTSPLSYITKPYKERDIIAILEIYRTRFERTILVKTKFGKKQIKISDILYIKAIGAYIEIVTDNNCYSERKNLGEIVDDLNGDFIRIHRSFIVNKNHIDQYTSSLVFINNEQIPISRSNKGILDTD